MKIKHHLTATRCERFSLRMEETLAESSQDMKPDQSWISEKIETVTHINTNTIKCFFQGLAFHLDLSGGGLPGGAQTEHLLSGSLQPHACRLTSPFNISDTGSLLPGHLRPLR